MLVKLQRLLANHSVKFWLLVNVAVATFLTCEIVRSFHSRDPENSSHRVKAMTAGAILGPQIGEPAPDFCLTKADGSGEVSLRSFRGKKPVVLIFGSYTCPVFRRRATALNAVYD